MPFELKRLILLTSIAAFAADTEHARFDPGPAARYANRQTSSGVTVAASAFETDDQARPAFGKVNPYKYGALPVLVIIENKSKDAIRADRIKVQYVSPGRDEIGNTPPRELRYLHGAQAPKAVSNPLPMGLPGLGRKKDPPLAEWEIEGRAFEAKMIPPGESASGFFYFQTGHRSGSKLIVSGLTDANSGQELLYYELQLENVR
jgi:hypothetical protein